MRSITKSMDILKNGKSIHISHRVLPYILLSPVVVYFALILIGPFAYGVALSFTDKRIGTTAKFIGFQNYIELFLDNKFQATIVNTSIYTLVSVTLKLIFGILMAVVLNAKIHFRNLARGLLLLPWAVPTVVSIFTWKWMFSGVGGVLNTILINFGLISSKIAWLSTPFMAMFCLIIVNVWRGTPFIGLSVLSGLQTISQDIYDAAAIDGAGGLMRFFYITLPSIKNVVMLSTLVTTIWTFNDFEIVWLLTRGGPINSTQVISTYSYLTGIIQMDLGKAVAASILFLPLMLLIVNIITGKVLNQKETD